MTHHFSSAVVRVMTIATIAFVYCSCKVGWTQTVDEILTKCRATVESISSYEYSAVSTSNAGREFRIFFARQGDANRYDLKAEFDLPAGAIWQTAPEFKAGFDGLYYYEYNEYGLKGQIEKICSPPLCMSSVIEPFQGCFGWLTMTNCRSELLKKSRWEDFAKTCEAVVAKQKIEGQSCVVVTSGPEINGRRYEVAFGEDVGYLPVRVRGLVGDEKKPVGESLLSEFKHFRIDGVSFYFPTKFKSQSLVEGAPNTHVTKLKPGTLYINRPIDSELLRLKYDPVGVDQ